MGLGGCGGARAAGGAQGGAPLDGKAPVGVGVPTEVAVRYGRAGVRLPGRKQRVAETVIGMPLF